jgi:hypothetical protein
LATVVGCHNNGGDDNPISNARVVAKERDLQGGMFESSCDSTPVDAVLSGLLSGHAVKSARVQYRFVGSNVTRSTVLFARGDCTGPMAYTFNETGKVAAINPDEKTADGGKTIDLEFNNLSVAISDEEGAKIANSMKLCDVVDWAVNQDRDVTGAANKMNCFRSALPTKEYTIYRIDGNALFLGSPSNNPGSRPSTLNLSRRYTSEGTH